ncbi:WEB family protein At1g75720-like [Impatiens glandulifera]|uniref:WEB family protein At1g75720-like n=1 Tax=Impatiens glandulifera TaxID=253017 RepID=UPI001FB09400|nr:WEB family protein At1g75720-like [Impatiens glandulifera]
MEFGGKIKIRSKAEIDTRAPFKSVKEAVTLFGDRLHVIPPITLNKIQIERNNMKEEDASSSSLRLFTIKGELEETKQNLQKAKDESMQIANCLYSLQEELERAKLEIQQLKNRESAEIQVMLKKEMECLKFTTENMEDAIEVKKHAVSSKKYMDPSPNDRITFLKSVDDEDHERVLLRHPSLKKTDKKKKKTLIPLIIGGLFCKMNMSSHKKYAQASEV